MSGTHHIRDANNNAITQLALETKIKVLDKKMKQLTIEYEQLQKDLGRK